MGWPIQGGPEGPGQGRLGAAHWIRLSSTDSLNQASSPHHSLAQKPKLPLILALADTD